MTHRTTLRLAGLMAAALFCLTPAGHAAALREKNIVVSSHSDTSRVAIRLDEAVVARVVDEVESHNYFFVDLYQTKPDFGGSKLFTVRDGVLKGFQTVYYPDLDVLRIIFYPANRAPFRVADRKTGFIFRPSPADAKRFSHKETKTDSLLIDTVRTPSTNLPPLDPGESATPAPRLRRARGKSAKRIVVIDPGHGGRSIGAVSRTRFGGKVLAEKDVVLAIGKEVARLLNKSPVVSAVLTRDRDEYVSLASRVKQTMDLEADLFVSIHCNAARYHKRNQAPRGIETYYLGETSNPDVRALEMAENEEDTELDAPANAALALITENLVKDMLDSTRAEGAEAAAAFNEVFLGDVYFKRFNRGVKNAKFKVLMNQVTAALLVEVGFIDHSHEVRNLANAAFQKRVAKLIANGILRHFANLDSEIEHYQYVMQ